MEPSYLELGETGQHTAHVSATPRNDGQELIVKPEGGGNGGEGRIVREVGVDVYSEGCARKV